MSCALSGLTLDTGTADITRAILESLAYGVVSAIDGEMVPENLPIHGGGPLFGWSPFARILSHTAGRTVLVVSSEEIDRCRRNPDAGAELTVRMRYDPDPALHALFAEARGRFHESVKKLACPLHILADIEKDLWRTILPGTSCSEQTDQ